MTRDDVLSDNDCTAKGFPLGTRSQFIRYFDSNGDYVVGVHRYWLKGGGIGASGMNDPKHLVIGGITYFL